MNTAITSSSDTAEDTPVLFIIFNRPDLTRQVFESIRKAAPSRLYIAADGPREHILGEAEKCKEARSITSEIDWDCQVRTLFRDENLGCGKGPTAAITWFFSLEAEGIILEDDCLPSPDFFLFCTELLKRYRNDTRVMQIGGNNFETADHRDDEYSYRFSNQISIWGWATWRRAWKFHDFNMGFYKEITQKKYLDASFTSIYERDYYQYIFQKMHEGDDQTNSRTIWDYQWQFACKINSGLVIIPGRNLVHNLGFGLNATNTLNPTGVGHNLELETLEFPLRHPEFVMVDEQKDNQLFKVICTSKSSRLKSRIKSIVPRPVFEFVRPIMQLFA